jgi:hypothetical protein
VSARRHRAAALLRTLAALAIAVPGAALAAEEGRALLQDSIARHAQPSHVYEEVTLVLRNAAGERRVRTARHYLRTDPDGSVQRMLVFESPADLRGTALVLRYDAGRPARRSLYLPALGHAVGYGEGAEASAKVPGTDFSVADLEPERTGDFRYKREADRDIDRVPHHVLRAKPKDEATARATGYADRRFFLRKDSLFVSRIDYFDRQGRLARQQTFRDPRPDGAGAWRPAMILMEDLRERHSTLLKIERRVHSPDYVPPELFAAAAR